MIHFQAVLFKWAHVPLSLPSINIEVSSLFFISLGPPVYIGFFIASVSCFPLKAIVLCSYIFFCLFWQLWTYWVLRGISNINTCSCIRHQGVVFFLSMPQPLQTTENIMITHESRKVTAYILLEKSYQGGKMIKITNWDHHIPLYVCVRPQVFGIFGCIILCGTNKTIHDHLGFQCVISLARPGQKIQCFPKLGRKQRL